jgi:hypothetical protein
MLERGDECELDALATVVPRFGAGLGIGGQLQQ